MCFINRSQPYFRDISTSWHIITNFSRANLQPNVFEDERGHFLESWSKEAFKNIGLELDFVQDNQSLSHKGVLRGLHFQNPPFSQGKLVRVIKGRVLDVSVDIRKESSTYGQHFSIELGEDNKAMLWLPPLFDIGCPRSNRNERLCSGMKSS